MLKLYQTQILDCGICGYAHREDEFSDCRNDRYGLMMADGDETFPPDYEDQNGDKWYSRHSAWLGGQTQREVMIPFSGFYETWHSGEIDRALEMELSDSSGDCYDSLFEHAWKDIPYRWLYRKYAEQYAETFATVYGIEGATFSEMTSPREYNFSTDRIFVKVPESEMQRIRSETKPTVFENVCKELFTSYDGFASFYDPDSDQWEDFETWDHNQLYALILAWMQSKDNAPATLEELEEDWFQGDIGEFCFWIVGTMPGAPEYHRVANIASYLRQREERKYRRVD